MSDQTQVPATICPGCGRSRPQEYNLCMPCEDKWDTMFPGVEFASAGTWEQNVSRAKLLKSLAKKVEGGCVEPPSDDEMFAAICGVSVVDKVVPTAAIERFAMAEGWPKNEEIEAFAKAEGIDPKDVRFSVRGNRCVPCRDDAVRVVDESSCVHPAVQMRYPPMTDKCVPASTGPIVNAIAFQQADTPIEHCCPGCNRPTTGQGRCRYCLQAEAHGFICHGCNRGHHESDYTLCASCRKALHKSEAAADSLIAGLDKANLALQMEVATLRAENANLKRVIEAHQSSDGGATVSLAQHYCRDCGAPRTTKNSCPVCGCDKAPFQPRSSP